VIDSVQSITLEEAERNHIRKTLEQAHWVISGPRGAAFRLGLKRTTLYWRMQKLGISRTKKTASLDAGHTSLAGAI